MLVSNQWKEDIFSQFIPLAVSLGFTITKLDNEAEITTTRIWKVSHSSNSINAEHLEWLEKNYLLAVHKNTGNGSVPCFEAMAQGDIVSLGYGNHVAKLVRVISKINTIPESPLGDNWLLRSYEIIKSLPTPVKYTGKHKRWSPRYNGTCWEVPKNEYWMFSKEILQPYYELSLKDLGFDTNQITKPKNTTAMMEVMDKSPVLINGRAN